MGQSILVTVEGLHVFAALCGKHATLVGGVAATGAAMGGRIGSISRAAQVTAARYEIAEQSNTEKLVGLRWV